MLSLLMSVGAMAGEKDEYFTLNAGFLFNSTLNASFGYERELTYGNAIELMGEVGNKWQRDPVLGESARMCSGKATIGMVACYTSIVSGSIRTVTSDYALGQSSEHIRADISLPSREDWSITMSFPQVSSFQLFRRIR